MKNIYKIISLNILGLILLTTYYFTYRAGFWFNIDSAIFHFFNAPLSTNKVYLYLVAVTNYRLFDVIAFLAMALLYLHYFLKQSKQDRRRMIAIGFTMLLMAVLIKQYGRFIPISHESPSLYFDHVNRVSQLTNFGTKDASGDSFPGDHGMMLMIFAAFMARYFGLKAFLYSAGIVVIFSLPRIMAGAHWFTDVYVGSLSMVSIVLSWFLLTPASDWVIGKLTKLFSALLDRFKIESL
ncbi:phosphatase PAP2 family protein [Zophobihabitans entericus]|uniref:Phosphatase PAP2 family protein n=1 Tax=Zophobihabitans entericus TaxID=1635327 RepID=A0A6G9IDY3_9GAMM|nr:phosphatase PAP2 family protein [Zophobihabitans entericus]QIQ22443.1 phosphatase PAP2 family protein [Zophobihabitans entericus]